MSKGGEIKKSFVCWKCRSNRITVQVLPGRTATVACWLCEQVYEVSQKNGEMLIKIVPEEKISSYRQGFKLQLVGG